MRYRTLGNTGLEISEIGFGCGTTAGLMVSGTPEQRRNAVARARLGVTYFDTAPAYGDTLSGPTGHAANVLARDNIFQWRWVR